nr:hypothetical protein [Candidatus Freyarchaeota archaeon]
MSSINPLYFAITFGAILSALDKLGIHPNLIARQSARVISPLIDDLSKTIGGDKPSNIEEAREFFESAMKNGPACSAIQTSASGKRFTTKLTECIFSPLADFVKSLGYGSCPVCAVSVILSGGIMAWGLGEISHLKIETKGKVCTLEINLLEK